MRNYTKDSRCVWSKTICGDLLIPQTGRSDNENHLESGEARGNMLTQRLLFVPPSVTLM